MRINVSFLGLFCLFIVTGVQAQSNMCTWIGAEAKFDLNNDWSIGVEAQSRTDLKLGRVDGLLLSPSVTWKPIKHLEAGLSYRVTRVPYASSTTNRVEKHRITADLNLVKMEKFFFKEKTRLGMSLRLRGTTEHQAEKRGENTLRLRFKLDYDLPKTKLDLYASSEIFYRFQRDLIYTFTKVESVNAINRHRLIMGMKHPIGDQHSIELFGLYQWQYPNETTETIIGLGYTFSFKSKKK